MTEEIDVESVKKLLIKHDYITTIQQSRDGCIITYPFPKLMPDCHLPAQLIQLIAIQRGTKPGFIVSTTYDKERKSKRFIPLPEYAMRLYIFCEIVANNTQIPIAPSLMVFLNEDGNEQTDIEDIIGSPEHEEEAKKESFLNRLLIEARNDQFPEEYAQVAESHGVGPGYKIIRKFYQ